MKLYHHGIKGQKWGIRRYQNADGTLTEAGKKRYEKSLIKKATLNDANEIYKTLSKDDRSKLNSQYNGQQEKFMDDDFIYDRASFNSFVYKHGNVPISLFYLERLGPEQTQVDIMTRSGDDYRGKGYASKTVETGMKWIENNTQIKDVFWDVRKDNIGSIKIAKKNGFEYVGDANKNWSTYKKTYKRD